MTDKRDCKCAEALRHWAGPGMVLRPPLPVSLLCLGNRKSNASLLVCNRNSNTSQQQEEQCEPARLASLTVCHPTRLSAIQLENHLCPMLVEG